MPGVDFKAFALLRQHALLIYIKYCGARQSIEILSIESSIGKVKCVRVWAYTFREEIKNLQRDGART